MVYPIVEVWKGENKEFGKIVYNFDTSFDAPGTPINTGSLGSNMLFPFVKSNSGFESGLKIEEKIYDTGSILKQKEEINYNKMETRKNRKIRCMAVYKRNQCPDDPIQLRYYDVIPYDINSNWYYIKKITSTNYEANGKYC